LELVAICFNSPQNSFHGLPEGQVEEEAEDEEEILFTVKYEEHKSYIEKVFCRGEDIIFCHSVMYLEQQMHGCP